MQREFPAGESGELSEVWARSGCVADQLVAHCGAEHLLSRVPAGGDHEPDRAVGCLDLDDPRARNIDPEAAAALAIFRIAAHGRGEVIDVVAEGPISLGALAERRGLTRSTKMRLASAPTLWQYLSFVPHSACTLGPKLRELGFRVRNEPDLPRVAAPHLARPALLTEDTVHLGALDQDHGLSRDQVPEQAPHQDRFHV